MFSLLILVIYLAFISLGLPDALLGSVWPIIHKDMDVDISYMGIITIIISFGTIVSSLLSDRLTRRFKASYVTVFSVLITAIALLGFSISNKFWMLIIFAIPYGLGAGSIDAALNNYVAIHYSSKHMSWLHCMWGVGASIGPYIMGYALMERSNWSDGFLIIFIIQIILTFIIFMSLPLWKNSTSKDKNNDNKTLSLKEIFRIKGAKEIMIAFFCYCALEQTAGLWASSYLVGRFNVNENIAASLASLFYLGITLGRAINGFLTIKFSDRTLIRIGSIIIFIGILLVFIPYSLLSYIGILIIGLGCAPIYPCIIHSTPSIFSIDKSQAIIGVEMASAYIGILLMPPLFGLIADYISINLFPMFLLLIFILMILMYRKLIKETK